MKKLLFSEPITDESSLREVCQKLSKEKFLAVDTEFIREKTYYPEIALIQIATRTESWLIDPLALSQEQLQPLFDILKNPKVIKVFHAAMGDQECLYYSYGLTASPSFDTAQGASLLGMGESIGLAKLLKELQGLDIDKGHSRTDWKVRPLPPQLLAYAHGDVKHLVETAEILFERLEKENRLPWALDLSQRYERPESFLYNAETQVKRHTKSGRLDGRAAKALTELFLWREKLATKINVPRRRVVEDDVLLDLAKVRPQTLDHLMSFRGLNKGLLKERTAEELLFIFQHVQKLEMNQLPKMERPQIPSLKEAQCLDLLNSFLKILAGELGLSSKHLIESENLLTIVRQSFDSLNDLNNSNLLMPETKILVAQPLFNFLQGKLILGLEPSPQGRKIKLTPSS